MKRIDYLRECLLSGRLAGRTTACDMDRISERLKAAFARPWIAIVGFFGIGMLPCPECGGPMIFHFWPLALGMVFVQIVRRRRRREICNSGRSEKDLSVEMNWTSDGASN